MVPDTHGQLQLLYEDSDIRVVASRHPSPGAVVTFSSLNEHQREFGRELFDRSGISGIYCVAKWNHWWQPHGSRLATGLILQALERLPPGPRLLYGSSMGAFGAALFSGRLQADTVLMLAPQFSIDPERPPHETRWRQEASRITFHDDELGSAISRTARKIVLFDSINADLLHAQMLAEIPGTELFATPYGGHAMGHFLLQTRLLQDIVLRAFAGNLDWAWYRAEVRARRRISGNYWNQLAQGAHAGRRSWALECFRRAAELRPQDPVLQNDYANALLRADRAEDAIAVFVLVSQMTPDAPAPLRGLSVAYRRLGRFEESIDHATRALALRPASTDLQRVLALALSGGGQHARALEVMAHVIEAEPDYAENARLQRMILAQAG
jgi:tetratricopeptide (TPR) repeat protein